MTKKLLAMLFAVLMIVTVMAGCTAPKEVWFSYSEYQEGAVANDDDTDATDGEDSDGKTQSSQTKRTKTEATQKKTVATGKKTRVTKAPSDALDFTPVADAGANYDVKGNVTIAIDTVRATDYDAMFDVMVALYPNINFTFDTWTSTKDDVALEYLTTRMATGTAANIIWDEAGEIPTYISQNWIEPITDYVAKDPEAKNLPANLKADYTFGGMLFALPHQASFEVTCFNTELMNKLGQKMPALEWGAKEYEAYLRAGAAGLNQGICVGIEDLFSVGRRFSYYTANAAGGDYSQEGYNYTTGQVEYKWILDAAKQMRTWREITGAEGWYTQQNKNSTSHLLQEKLGVSNYSTVWDAGKSLMIDAGTWSTENWDSLTFDWVQWTAPNTDGNMMMHVDHCFITRGTPKADMDACFQALRFMTYSTNGNLARLTMYEDSQKGKYNLTCHVYYPTTTSTAVAEKFNNLSCTDKADEYMFANIKNSSRLDSFKIVPGLNTAREEWGDALNDVTDGLDPAGTGVPEAADRVNQTLKEAKADFEKDLAKYYK